MRNTVLIWAWWTWMSGIAWILHDLWYWENLICLDSTESELTQKLQKKWIKVIIWENKYLPDITDNIIYSEACINSPEVLHAKSYQRTAKQQRFIGNYFDFLGELSKYFTTIWVTGTNWKSTTTSLALYTAKKHLPNLWLGILWALVPDLDWNNYFVNQNHKSDIKNIFDQILNGKWLDYSLIKKYYFILEACEYKRHFLCLDIDRWIITNIELDHTDYYKDINDYTLAFQQFTDKVKNKIFTTEILDLKSQKIQKIETKIFNFKYIFGTHNNKNWSLVKKLINEINIKYPPSKDWIKKINKDSWCKDTISCIQETIQNFKWLRRRLEYLTTTEKWTIIFSDYGHMASSIKICFDALKTKYPDKKIIAIFQPHQAARIIKWREDFPKALKLYNENIIFDIYAARENLDNLIKKTPIKWIKSIKDLWQKLAEKTNGIYTTNFDTIKQKIHDSNSQEIIVIFSAWDLDFKIRSLI